MLNFNSILLFSENPQRLADFYATVFQTDPIWNEEGYTSFKAGDGYLTIGPHDEVHGKNQNPQRIMLNFETDNVQQEFERIKNLGCRVIAEPYSPSEEPEGLIATFEDPDGNYFQLVTPFDISMEN